MDLLSILKGGNHHFFQSVPEMNTNENHEAACLTPPQQNYVEEATATLLQTLLSKKTPKPTEMPKEDGEVKETRSDSPGKKEKKEKKAIKKKEAPVLTLKTEFLPSFTFTTEAIANVKNSIQFSNKNLITSNNSFIAYERKGNVRLIQQSDGLHTLLKLKSPIFDLGLSSLSSDKISWLYIIQQDGVFSLYKVLEFKSKNDKVDLSAFQLIFQLKGPDSDYFKKAVWHPKQFEVALMSQQKVYFLPFDWLLYGKKYEQREMTTEELEQIEQAFVLRRVVSEPTDLAYSLANVLAISNAKGSIRLIYQKDERPSESFQAYGNEITQLLWLNEKYLASYCQKEACIKLWQTDNWALKQTVQLRNQDFAETNTVKMIYIAKLNALLLASSDPASLFAFKLNESLLETIGQCKLTNPILSWCLNTEDFQQTEDIQAIFSDSIKIIQLKNAFDTKRMDELFFKEQEAEFLRLIEENKTSQQKEKEVEEIDNEETRQRKQTDKLKESLLDMILNDLASKQIKSDRTAPPVFSDDDDEDLKDIKVPEKLEDIILRNILRPRIQLESKEEEEELEEEIKSSKDLVNEALETVMSQEAFEATIESIKVPGFEEEVEEPVKEEKEETTEDLIKEIMEPMAPLPNSNYQLDPFPLFLPVEQLESIISNVLAETLSKQLADSQNSQMSSFTSQMEAKIQSQFDKMNKSLTSGLSKQLEQSIEPLLNKSLGPLQKSLEQQLEKTLKSLIAKQLEKTVTAATQNTFKQLNTTLKNTLQEVTSNMEKQVKTIQQEFEKSQKQYQKEMKEMNKRHQETIEKIEQKFQQLSAIISAPSPVATQPKLSLRDQVEQLLKKEEYDQALTLIMENSQFELFEEITEQLQPEVICPLLSQSILLTLTLWMSMDLTKQYKMNWIQEALMSLDTSNESIQKHFRKTLSDILTHLQKQTDRGRQVKILIRLTNSLLNE